jgi:glycosyltransferase involved in cell wall biosynthesis
MILLIGNYPLDRQQSMQRFALMMLAGLHNAGIPAELIQPSPFFGRFRFAGSFVAKWLGYLDKFVLFRRQLARKLRERPAAVHICDHSNAMYTRAIHDVPVVVTCHDLLAVRGALGEDTGCPASVSGKFLQRWIVSGLRKADIIVADSLATLEDAKRVVGQEHGRPKMEKVTLGLSYPFQKLSAAETRKRLSEFSAIQSQFPFVLHVGSNVAYKNRAGVLRIFAACGREWNGRLVFAGEALSGSLRSLGHALGVADRIVELPEISSESLEALYNGAVALLFPSSAEGFGWPIAEAQACGCPVLCVDRPPMNEVAASAGLTHPLDDEAGFAADILRLTNPAERELWSARSLENAQRFSTARMISEYGAVYRSIAAGPTCAELQST